MRRAPRALCTFDMSTDISTTILPLLPLDDGVILPNMAIAIAITSDEARAAVDDALATDGPPRVVIATRRNGQFSPIGVVAELDGQPAMLPGGIRGATIRALHRAELGQGQGEGIGGAFRIAVTEHPDSPEVSEHAHELAREYRIVIEEILEARGASGIVAFLRTIDHPGALADTAGYSPDLSLERKIELLETLDVELRLERALAWARDTLAEIELRRKIRDDVAEDMDKSQREYVLRRQLDAIRKELGDEDGGDDTERYRERIAETPLSDEARKEAERELGRLQSTGPGHPEASTIRTYLDWLLSLPWGKESDDQDDVAAAGAVLEADHAGLEEVKERILEYLAVRSFRRKREIEDEGGGAILCLVGPSRRRQDVAGRVDRPCARARVRAHEPRRHPRRGRDPRSPAHLHRRTAGPPRARPARRRHDEPGDPARRGRQARRRLARRSVVRAARGARPGAELDVPRSLPRPQGRPLEGALHRHGERRRADPRGLARPPRGHPHRRLHRGREGRHRAALPRAARRAPQRARGRTRSRSRRRRCGASSPSTRARPASATSSA